VAKNSPNLAKVTNLHIQEVEWNPNRINTKKFMLSYMTVENK
jgi:hypothetical protein